MEYVNYTHTRTDGSWNLILPISKIKILITIAYIVAPLVVIPSVDRFSSEIRNFQPPNGLFSILAIRKFLFNTDSIIIN